MESRADRLLSRRLAAVLGCLKTMYLICEWNRAFFLFSGSFSTDSPLGVTSSFLVFALLVYKAFLSSGDLMIRCFLCLVRLMRSSLIVGCCA